MIGNKLVDFMTVMRQINKYFYMLNTVLSSIMRQKLFLYKTIVGNKTKQNFKTRKILFS